MKTLMKKLIILFILLGAVLQISAQKAERETIKLRRSSPQDISMELHSSLKKFNMTSQEYTDRGGRLLANAGYYQVGTLILGGSAIIVSTSSSSDSAVTAVAILGVGAAVCQVASICYFVKAGRSFRLSVLPSGAAVSYNF